MSRANRNVRKIFTTRRIDRHRIKTRRGVAFILLLVTLLFYDQIQLQKSVFLTLCDFIVISSGLEPPTATASALPQSYSSQEQLFWVSGCWMYTETQVTREKENTESQITTFTVMTSSLSTWERFGPQRRRLFDYITHFYFLQIYYRLTH